MSTTSVDPETLVSISKNRNKLLKLADGIKPKGRKGSSNLSSGGRKGFSATDLSSDLSHTNNIEHLVFGSYRQLPSTPSQLPGSQGWDGSRSPQILASPDAATNGRGPTPQTISPAKCECKAHSPTTPSLSEQQSAHFDTSGHQLNRSLSNHHDVCSESSANDRSNDSIGSTTDLLNESFDQLAEASEDNGIIDMEETLRPDNISFFAAEMSYESNPEWTGNNDNSDTPSSALTINGKSKIPVFNNKDNKGNSPMDADQVERERPLQVIPIPIKPTPSPLRPSHVKHRDSLIRSQSCTRLKNAERRILSQNQVNQTYSKHSHPEGCPRTQPIYRHNGEMNGVAECDPRKYFRRQNSLPSYIPKFGSRRMPGETYESPVTLVRRTALYSPHERQRLVSYSPHDLGPFQQQQQQQLLSHNYSASGVYSLSQQQTPNKSFSPNTCAYFTQSTPNKTSHSQTNSPSAAYPLYHYRESPSLSCRSPGEAHPSTLEAAAYSSSVSKLSPSCSTSYFTPFSTFHPQHALSKGSPDHPGKVQSNLQRNRPLVRKASTDEKRAFIKPRSFSLTNGRDLAFDDRYPSPSLERGDSPIPYQRQQHVLPNSRGHPNKPLSVKYDNLFIMDEDSNFTLSPKKLLKSPHISNNSPSSASHGENYYATLADNGLSQHSPVTSPANRVYNTTSYPSSALSSPEKKWTPSEGFPRPRSASDHQLSAMLLSDAQKQSLGADDSEPEMSTAKISKSGRPWSHIYTDFEVRKLLNYKNLFGSATSLGKKQKSETDISQNRHSSPQMKTNHRPMDLDIATGSLTPIHSTLSEPASDANHEVDSVMQKFKKSFSLRFNRIGNNTRGESGVKNKLRQSMRAKSEESRRDAIYVCQPLSPPNYRISPHHESGLVYHNHNICHQDIREDEALRGCESERQPRQRKLSEEDCEQLKERLRRTPSVERQFSTPDPVKLRDSSPVAHRYPGRSQLRRSLSQPQNIEKLDYLKRGGSRESLRGAISGSSQVSSESESDSESLHGFSSHLTRGSSEQLDDESGFIYVEALWDHVTLENEELSFRAGEVIEVTDFTDKHWWWGSTGDRSGFFPSSYVRRRVNQEETVEECMSKIADGTVNKTPKKRMSISLLSNEQVRANVVLEIINTEKDFVKHLNDVVEGYLVPVRRHKEMFTEERISTIFGNIEQLYRFQQSFLSRLEKCIVWEKLNSSAIGECFLEHEEGFRVYSDYCNNHPLAVTELQDLYAEPKYAHFFEACRLLRNMIDISLDGFLLTPIQKICKYPLQLAELLKYTKNDHKDYEPVKSALAAMKRVAHLVNDRKRRIESLEQLLKLEKSIDCWEGPLLTDTSSVLINSGEITRVFSSSWSQTVTMFLFDHLLVYCKRDLLGKRYVFKGRIDMDLVSSFENIEDGSKDKEFNITTKNAFKMYSESREKWFLFSTKTSHEKKLWLRAFEDEKRQTREDREQNFVVTDKEKRAAQMYLLNKQKPKRPRVKMSKGSKPRRPDTAVAEMILDPNFDLSKGRAGSLPSYLNPATSTDPKVANRQVPIKKKGSGWFHLGSSKKRSKSRSVKRAN